MIPWTPDTALPAATARPGRLLVRAALLALAWCACELARSPVADVVVHSPTPPETR